MLTHKGSTWASIALMVGVGANLTSCSSSSDSATTTTTDTTSTTGTTGTTATTSGYTTLHLPSNYKLEIPAALNSGSSGAGGARIKTRVKNGRLSALSRIHQSASGNAETVSDSTYSSQSYGYSELKDAVSHITTQTKQLDSQFTLVDGTFDQVLAYCGDTSPCNVPEGAVTQTVTQEMVDRWKSEYKSYYPSEADRTAEDTAAIELQDSQMDLMVGIEQPMPALTLTDVSAETGGFQYQVTFDTSFSGSVNTLSLKWDEAKTKIVFTQSWDSGDWGKGYTLFNYDDSTKVMSVKDSYEYSGSKFEHTVTLTSDESNAKHGAFITANLSSSGIGSDYVEDIAGYVDDDGGYLETGYSYSYYDFSITAGTLTDGNYLVVPSSVAAVDADWSNAVGSIYSGYGTSFVSYWGSGITANTAVSDIKIFSYSYDLTTYEVAIGDEVTGIQLTAGAKNTYNYSYREAFDGAGTLTATAYKSDADSDWTTMSGTFEDVAYDDTYTEATETGEFAAPVTVTLSGQSDESATYYLVRDGSIPDGENWDVTIGYSYHDGTAWVTSYWGSDEDAATAEVYKLTYDFSLDNYYVFTADSTITVTVE